MQFNEYLHQYKIVDTFNVLAVLTTTLSILSTVFVLIMIYWEGRSKKRVLSKKDIEKEVVEGSPGLAIEDNHFGKESQRVSPGIVQKYGSVALGSIKTKTQRQRKEERISFLKTKIQLFKDFSHRGVIMLIVSDLVLGLIIAPTRLIYLGTFTYYPYEDGKNLILRIVQTGFTECIDLVFMSTGIWTLFISICVYQSILLLVENNSDTGKHVKNSFVSRVVNFCEGVFCFCFCTRRRTRKNNEVSYFNSDDENTENEDYNIENEYSVESSSENLDSYSEGHNDHNEVNAQVKHEGGSFQEQKIHTLMEYFKLKFRMYCIVAFGIPTTIMVLALVIHCLNEFVFWFLSVGMWLIHLNMFE